MSKIELKGFKHNNKSGGYCKIRKDRKGGGKGIITNQKGAFGRSRGAA